MCRMPLARCALRSPAFRWPRGANRVEAITDQYSEAILNHRLNTLGSQSSSYKTKVSRPTQIVTARLQSCRTPSGLSSIRSRSCRITLGRVTSTSIERSQGLAEN
ncbi:hypothetical protein CBM2589_A70282 [Cupriavidus taiwanensis]|uniref:Uncharacterized protein n=1 Tax=Cupriavidus taiwanensis TaxID=164546 RepID=A0A375C7F5_9BURK|nr:hypothetical protein CBM2589_A70282 [Cupriavidus taiwanensis]